jgi:hypothetical protein
MVNSVCTAHPNSDGSYQSEPVTEEACVSRIYTEKLAADKNEGFDIMKIQTDVQKVMRSVALKEILRGPSSIPHWHLSGLESNGKS